MNGAPHPAVLPRTVLAVLVLLLAACESSPPRTSSASLSTLTLTLPDGAKIEAELAVTPEQQARGLMFREALPPDRGMLFIFPRVERRPFWMFQTRIPLDMIWIDQDRRIVEIAAHTPPCLSGDPAGCPSYGGQADAKYVLEIAAGQAEAHRLSLGDLIVF